MEFQNSQLQEGEEHKFKTGIYKQSQDTTVVAVAGKRILYMGAVSKKKDKDDLYNRFLLISNRKTGKVKALLFW